jgi:hypothetical protein
MRPKMYLGDSVYISYDGFQFCLTTENGGSPSNTIFLDHEVVTNLIFYCKRAMEATVQVTVKETETEIAEMETADQEALCEL